MRRCRPESLVCWLNFVSDGLTVVFISHDLHAVRFVANQLVVLHDGGVVEKGNLADIISSPKSDIARVLMNAQD